MGNFTVHKYVDLEKVNFSLHTLEVLNGGIHYMLASLTSPVMP